jgi:hypothetical protein
MTNLPAEQKRWRSAGERWGRWHWVRVLGLRCFYFPFWRTVNTVRRAHRAAFDRSVNLVTTDELWKLTEPLDEHPEGWEHACMCATCRSYADG